MDSIKTICRVLFFAAGCGLLPVNGASAACASGDDALKVSGSPQLEALVRERFTAADYDCGIRAVQLRTKAVSALAGDENTNARFDLRNLALALSQDATYPTDKRLQLLVAASPSYVDSHSVDSPENIKFDALMFYKAGEQFGQQRDTNGILQSLVLGIGLDSRLPDDKKVREYWNFELYGLGGDVSKLNGVLGQLLALSQVTKGGYKGYIGIRCKIASYAYGQGGFMLKDEDSAVLQERAQQLLQIADALSDVQICQTVTPNWRWRPVFGAGMAYYRSGDTQKGLDQIQHAMQLVLGDDKPVYRVYQGNILLMDLVMAKLAPPGVCAFAATLMGQIDQLDPPHAADARWELPIDVTRLNQLNAGCPAPPPTGPRPF